MCAGSAQVTLVELRGSYCTGCNHRNETKQTPKTTQKTHKQPKPNHKTTAGRKDRNLLCNLGGDRSQRAQKGETGAMNSATLSTCSPSTKWLFVMHWYLFLSDAVRMTRITRAHWASCGPAIERRVARHLKQGLTNALPPLCTPGKAAAQDLESNKQGAMREGTLRWKANNLLAYQGHTLGSPRTRLKAHRSVGARRCMQLDSSISGVRQSQGPLRRLISPWCHPLHCRYR